MNSTAGCAEAEIYLYDVLVGEANESVPAEQARHIEECPSCQAKLRDLEIILKDPAGRFRPGTHERNAALARLLKAHFAYLNKPVDCARVKVFLPSMADPLLAITTPTPITVHIDQCPACSADLHAIRQLQLTQGQLCRLSVFLAGAARTTDRDDARQNDAMQEEPQPPEHGREELTCPELSPQDVFDCILPHSSAETLEKQGDRTETSHACRCPDCQGKIRLMRQTLTWMARRPASGVLTCLRLRQQEGDAPRTKVASLYADWPVDVQVLRQPAHPLQENTDRPFSGRFQGERATAALRWLPRWAVAAAAILLVGYVMFIGTPSVQAVTLGQLYEALQKAGNVCITSLLANAAEPRQREWISRSLSLSLFENRDAYALWDMSSRTIRTRPLDGGQVETIEMSDDVFARGRRRMTRAPGLVPFDKIADLPEGATWEKVADPNATAPVAGTEMYDLVWTTPIPTIPPTRQTERWRFFIDPRTHLPARLEIYSQAPTDTHPRLHKTLLMTYPADREIQALVRTLFPDPSADTAARRP